MGLAYSEDLRERVVKAYTSGQGTYTELAELFSISSKTVQTYVKQARSGGSLTPLPHSGGRTSQKLFEPHYEAIERWLEEDSELFWWEVAQRLEAEFGVHIDPSQISRQMKRRGYTQKKQQTVISKSKRRRSRENVRDGEAS